MAEPFGENESGIDRHVPTWLPVLLRVAVVGLVARPAVSKFVSRSTSVAFFTRLGIPSPELMVLVSGVVEVLAVGLVLFGVAERLAAASLIPVMAVAIVYAGPSVSNIGVLLACVGLLVVGSDDSRFLFTAADESPADERPAGEASADETLAGDPSADETPTDD